MKKKIFPDLSLEINAGAQDSILYTVSGLSGRRGMPLGDSVSRLILPCVFDAFFLFKGKPAVSG